MKVLWICKFSNAPVREKLGLSVSLFEVVLRKVLRKGPKQWDDSAAWITNGLVEFEKFTDIELHVVSPHYGMVKKNVSFQLNGINYHFFKPDNDTMLKRLRGLLFKKIASEHTGNRNFIKRIVSKLNPDLIHMYGAENPIYSIAALDIDTKKFPFFVSLQTLMSDPGFFGNYFISKDQYSFRVGIEKDIIKRIKYIGTSVPGNRNIIWSGINPNAIFFDSFLAIEQNVEVFGFEKKYDFVFFAASIAKLADVAIEAFALACKKHPDITLNIIGSTPEPFTGNLKLRIKELGVEKNVFFSGKLPEHKDVLEQIQYSRFALLPLKVDFISGTIREAIYAGLPVITMKTHGTPLLNEKRRSVLISEQNDIQGMADNMCKLIESPALVQELTVNSLITLRERYSNTRSMRQLTEVYRAIIAHHTNQTPIPSYMGAQNPNISNEEQN
jgi:glycosyltransferase involved in cell wall biosynthesis